MSIILMLWRLRGIPEVYWVGGGALILVLFRLIPSHLAGRAIAQGLDVYLFLAGMMLFSELARKQGVFEWMSASAIRGSNGSCAHLFRLIYISGTLVTIFMSNDATAIVLTPAILPAIRKAGIAPLPYLYICALVANAASFVLPISNPANLVVFHKTMPALGPWLLAFGVPSLLSIATTYFVLRWIFRRELSCQFCADAESEALPENGRIVIAGFVLAIFVLLAASSLKLDLGLPTCLTAVAVTAAVCIKTQTNPLKLAKELSWSTLALVAALFIMVDAMESVGALKFSAASLAYASSLPPAAGALLTSFVTGAANNLINNLPVGLITGKTLQVLHTSALIRNSILIGVDLGPNLSVTGSLATILWLIALRREKINMSFVEFLKIGAIVMPAALLTSISSAILLQVIFKPC